MDTVVKQRDEQEADRTSHDYKHEHQHCHVHHRRHEHHRRHDDDEHHHHKGHHEHHKSHHIHELEKTIESVADALAGLGRGAHLHELLRIIQEPGWTTKAELAFVNAILDNIGAEVRTLDRLQADLVEASRKVNQECRHYD